MGRKGRSTRERRSSINAVNECANSVGSLWRFRDHRCCLAAAGDGEDDAAGGRPGHLPALLAGRARRGDSGRCGGGALQQGGQFALKSGAGNLGHIC